jgi:hypothetical protein
MDSVVMSSLIYTVLAPFLPVIAGAVFGLLTMLFFYRIVKSMF